MVVYEGRTRIRMYIETGNITLAYYVGTPGKRGIYYRPYSKFTNYLEPLSNMNSIVIYDLFYSIGKAKINLLLYEQTVTVAYVDQL